MKLISDKLNEISFVVKFKAKVVGLIECKCMLYFQETLIVFVLEKICFLFCAFKLFDNLVF